jgi:hypothetical protein
VTGSTEFGIFPVEYELLLNRLLSNLFDFIDAQNTVPKGSFMHSKVPKYVPLATPSINPPSLLAAYSLVPATPNPKAHAAVAKLSSATIPPRRRSPIYQCRINLPQNQPRIVHLGEPATVSQSMIPRLRVPNRSQSKTS